MSFLSVYLCVCFSYGVYYYFIHAPSTVIPLYPLHFLSCVNFLFSFFSFGGKSVHDKVRLSSVPTLLVLRLYDLAIYEVTSLQVYLSAVPSLGLAY